MLLVWYILSGKNNVQIAQIFLFTCDRKIREDKVNRPPKSTSRQLSSKNINKKLYTCDRSL